MFYYGTPACFTDTTDSWMLPKGKRLAVDVAGVVANFIMGAILSIVAVLYSENIAYKYAMFGAIVNYLIIIVNLSPFLKFDGYYLLSDLLDKTNLREDAIVSLFTLKQKRIPELGLLLFGLCSIVHSSVTIILLVATVFWGIPKIIPSPYGIIVSFGVTTLLILSLLINFVKKIRMYKEVHT